MKIEEGPITLHRKKILLVTGNGFDLQCGLTSKYIDYFRYLKANNFMSPDTWYLDMFEKASMATTLGMVGEAIHDIPKLKGVIAGSKNSSLWELYLAIKLKDYKKDDYLIDWFDVEKEIKDSLKEGAFWDQVFDYLYEQKEKKQTMSDGPNLLVYCVSYAIQSRSKTNILIPSDKAASKENFYRELLKELEILESNFGKFLKEIVSNRYLDIREDYLEKIIDRFEESINESSVLTFNYTSLGSRRFNMYYVHGDLSHPIFGIDKSPRTDNELNMFTKISRRRSYNLMKYSDILDGMNSNEYALVFYGTSFSDLDNDDYEILFKHFDTICVLTTPHDFKDNLDETRNRFRLLYKKIMDIKTDHDLDLLEEQGNLNFGNINFDKK